MEVVKEKVVKDKVGRPEEKSAREEHFERGGFNTQFNSQEVIGDYGHEESDHKVLLEQLEMLLKLVERFGPCVENNMHLHC